VLAGIRQGPVSWSGHGTIALQKARPIGAAHRFGGRHTDDKLTRLRAYLQAFTSALKHQGFVLIYIDAFAGSGDRTDVIPALPLLGGDNAEPQTVNVPGSARLAIEIIPPFDRLVLIENDLGRHAALDQLRAEFPERDIECPRRDANDVVQDLCRRAPWRGSNVSKGMRGVIFLDPYGMEVEWGTVETIAATRALDLWYFFPLMGLYRQAANDVIAIDANKRARLNRVLGTDEWERAWYGTPHGMTDLLDDPQTAIRTADVNAIERYVKSRLASIFKGAVLDPLRIYHQQGAPIASLFFAVSNPSQKAVQVATDIARYILRQPARRSPARRR
jgi:three-Cys-motif partner protein